MNPRLGYLQRDWLFVAEIAQVFWIVWGQDFDPLMPP